jgi:hypothetical protein
MKIGNITPTRADGAGSSYPLDEIICWQFDCISYDRLQIYLFNIPPSGCPSLLVLVDSVPLSCYGQFAISNSVEIIYDLFSDAFVMHI